MAAATPSPPPPLPSQISPLQTNDSYDTSIIMILVSGTRLTVPQRHQQQPLKYEAILWHHHGDFLHLSHFCCFCLSVHPSVPPLGLPPGSEVLPAGFGALPAGSRALTAGSEPLPAGSKAHPA